MKFNFIPHLPDAKSVVCLGNTAMDDVSVNVHEIQTKLLITSIT